MTTEEAFAIEIHKFTMEFFQNLNTIEPNPEMMEIMSSEKGLRLIKSITDFYCQVLSEDDIAWIIDNNLNGRGRQIIDKLMDSMDLFRTVLVPRIQEFEQ